MALVANISLGEGGANVDSKRERRGEEKGDGGASGEPVSGGLFCCPLWLSGCLNGQEPRMAHFKDCSNSPSVGALNHFLIK